jgi:hypothetical protein
MPTPDASQYTQIKRLIVDKNGRASLNPTKFRAPFFYGGYGFVQGIETKFGPNALLSNKFIITPPTTPSVTGPGGIILANVTVTSILTIRQINFRGNLIMDWGDGSQERFDSETSSGTSISHTYAESGTYNISGTVDAGTGDITIFDCRNNLFNSIDASGCTPLTSITCNGNVSLSSLDVANTQLGSIAAQSCNLTSIANLISIQPYLRVLNLSNNPVASLTLNGYNALLTFTLNNSIANSLTSLDIQNCTSLTGMFVATNTNLTSLDVHNNLPALTTLVVSQCTGLATLRIDGTLLNAISTIGTNTVPILNPLIAGTVTMSSAQASVYPGSDPTTYYATALPSWTFVII